jgi:hypothetical protein
VQSVSRFCVSLVLGKKKEQEEFIFKTPLYRLRDELEITEGNL